ncbi:MAG: heavy metal translocating P-type ATPase, partial [Verrucomicrobiia bacterium]
AGARAAGAKVARLEVGAGKGGWWERLRSGELHEEISCGLGLACLVAGGVGEGVAEVKSAWVWGAYAGAYLFCGQAGVRSAVASLREKTLDVDLLMVLAAVGAALVGAPFEGALLLFLFSFSDVLQRYALERTRRAIGALMRLRPDRALRKVGGLTEEVPVESLEVGDRIWVRPGELLPVDGVVVEGVGSVDESSLTGESMPVGKGPGSRVFAGTLNGSGGLEVAVGRKAEDSTLAKMVRLVAEAQAEKSGTQRFLERAEQRYAAGVIGLTALVWLVPWLGWGEPFEAAFYRAMTVMVVASPCALIISTPATVLSAIGGAARRGVLIKGGAHLETAARVEIVALDKTGTLTVGKPTVTEIVTGEGVWRRGHFSEKARHWLGVAAALEARSEHPLAGAVVRGARELGLVIPETTGFRAEPGRGAEGWVSGQRVMIGSERWLAEVGVEVPGWMAEAVGRLEGEGKTCVMLAVAEGEGWRVRAAFALADTLRPEARELVKRLHGLGVRRVVMLTGDRRLVAEAVGREAGGEEVRAELLPEDKVKAIRELKGEGTVMMVGDGVNDAAALATAHVGVAMGAAGTDVAMETADVVLMGDRLDLVPMFVGMARHARRVLTQNLVFAGGVILVLLGAALGFALPLPLGVIGHEGSTVLVCLNGLRLLGYARRG